MSEIPRYTFGDYARDMNGALASAVMKETFDKGGYLQFVGEFKTNKWGMFWPLNKLDDQTVERCITVSRYGSLRVAVGLYVRDEGKKIWEAFKPVDYDPTSGRSPFDLAVNDGYKRAGEMVGSIYNPDIKKVDPTGKKWIRQQLQDEATVWNDIHKHKPEFDTPEDPAIMGFRQAVERYVFLYDSLIVAGAKPDKHKRNFLPRFG